MTTVPDTLARLWASTADLYAAHGLDASSVPPLARRRYFAEEADELKEASVLQEKCLGSVLTDVADEAADVLVTVCGLLQAHGITPEELAAACERVMAKNDQKRDPEWTMVGGKIRRRE